MMTLNKTPFTAVVLAFGAMLSSAPGIGIPPVGAQPKAPTVVPGQRIGRVYLGYTPAQVQRTLGKPDKTLRLRNGTTDDIYLAKKTRLRFGQAMRDKLEILYRKGRVVQIEATSPAFETTSGLSTGSSLGQLIESGWNWRVLAYQYTGEEDGWHNNYFVDQKKGLSFEFEICQEELGRDSTPTTLLVHRAGTRPLADVGGTLVTDSIDLSVVMYD